MGISIVNLGCSFFGIRLEENPKYEILHSEGNMEIRSYASQIVAKTKIKGDFKTAQGEAFRILAAYIFGNNEKRQKLSMTAPVVQEKSAESEKLAMTAPVIQSSTQDDWSMSFMMPSKYQLAELPLPKDTRIALEEIPPKIFGVTRYSGLGKQSTNIQMANELKTWLLAQGKYEIVSEASWAGYDPPWTIPFLRRNEMLYEIKLKD